MKVSKLEASLGYMKLKPEGAWGDGSAGKVLPVQAGRPEFHPSTHVKKLGVGMCPCDPSTEGRKTGGFLEWAGQPVQLNSELPARERLSQKIR